MLKDLLTTAKEALLLNVDVDLKHVQLLRYPEDASLLASLSLIEKQMWYAGQEPRHMIYLSLNPQFKRFWKIHYLWPLKIKRMLYKIKAVFKF
jgi:hypothetical protein